MRNFRELIIWQESYKLSVKLVQLTKSFPAEEKYGLVSQIRRSAISIPANIAEGSGRNSNNEFRQFLHIALGSAFELETELMICRDCKFASADEFENLIKELNSIQKMLLSFISKVNTQPNNISNKKQPID
jgi:four helix bundle protein